MPLRMGGTRRSGDSGAVATPEQGLVVGKSLDPNRQDILSVIVDHWGPEFTRLYGHNWPDSYLSIDTEYTGGNAEKDVICEIGHTIVEDQQVVDRLNIIIDWTDHPVVPLRWLRQALERIQARMAPGAWRITLDVMREEGIKPDKALNFYYDLMQTWKSRKLPFVAHNGFHADERMIRGHFEGFLGKTFRFGENGLFDTGAIFKATQALVSTDAETRAKRKLWLPQQNDTLESYFRRVVNHPAKGVKWKMWECIEHFGLDVKYQLRQADCHGAGYDSYLAHLLMEEYRTYITSSNSDETGVESPEALQRLFTREMAAAKLQREAGEVQAKSAEAEFEARQAVQPKRPADFAQRRRKQRSV